MQTEKNLGASSHAGHSLRQNFPQNSLQNSRTPRASGQGRTSVVPLCGFLAALSLLFASCNPDPGEPGVLGEPSALLWSDEFNGSSVDPSKWTFETGNGCPSLCGWGNNESQYYQAANATIEDFSDGERGLVIEARKESVGGFGYTSARMKTQGLASWTYGRFEARIKLPKGRGIWPAFWMLGDNITEVGWPVSGEIDIMELVGHEPNKVHGTFHYGDPGHKYDGGHYSLPTGDFSDDFHIFTLEWEPGELRWYVDGTLYSRQAAWTTSLPEGFPAPFDRNFFLLLNLAVGGQWPGYPDGSTVFPQRMYVDYVRVYSLDGG